MPDEESIEFRNDVPGIERALVGFFFLVGGPMVWLAWTEGEALPGWAVPLFGAIAPALIIGYAWKVFSRHRIRAAFPAGATVATIEERRRWGWDRTQVAVTAVELDIGEDIDGDPYGRLQASLDDGRWVTLDEGNDIDGLRHALARVRAWIDA